MNRIPPIILFALLLLPHTYCAQSIELAGRHGFLAAHRNHMMHLVQQRTFGGLISLEKKASGEKKWHHEYGLPSYGVSAEFVDWGNRDQLGYGIGIYPYIKFPLIHGERSALKFKLGGGAGYITRTWDRKTNHKNTVFSSPYTVVVHLSAPYSVNITPHLSAYITPSFTHMSNGATSLPNSGGNYLSLESGIGYRFRSEPETTPASEAENGTEKPGLSVLTVGKGFFKEGAFELTGKRPAGTLTFEIARRISRKSALQGGVDLMYNGTLETVYSEHGFEQTPHFKRMQYGISAGYHLVFDSWELYVKQGVYLHSRLYPDGRLYHRFGARAHLNENWILNGGIKSHFFVADYLELGLGRTLWKRK